MVSALMVEKIRYGGREIGGAYHFELTGGALALDFVNTLYNRIDDPRELLTTYKRLLDWSEQSGALSKMECNRLSKIASKTPRKANWALKEACGLRELLYSIVSNAVHGDSTSADELNALNRWIEKANSKRCLSNHAGDYVWRYLPEDGDFTAMLWPIVFSIESMLTDKHSVSRIKICEGDTCAWAFLDNSRPGNKRWCDMTVCGNRAKARRHRAKSRSRSVRRAT